MPRTAPPEAKAEILGILVALGPKGGTYLDIFEKSETLSESTIRYCLIVLERERQVIRKPRFMARAGRLPDMWRAATETSKERGDA